MVLQITDTHLGRQAGDRLLGMDTDASLAAVLALLDNEQPRPELLLATGDLSNSGHAEAYTRLATQLQGRSDNIAWIPGNHDEGGLMRSAGPSEWMVERVDLGSWQVLLLDSSVVDEVGGSLAPAQLDILRGHLQSNPDQHALIFLHHHVLPVGCAWLDEQRVDNADQLLALLEPFSNVKMLVSGHVHQQTEQRWQDIPFITTPSTCIQFAPDSEDFAVDLINPGYRWFRLHDDGRIETDVSRVEGFASQVDTRARGY